MLDADEHHLDRERWSYPRLADQLRRWSEKPVDDRIELFRRMVFNAAARNNDDHPRNPAMRCTAGGWRVSTVPVRYMSLPLSATITPYFCPTEKLRAVQ